MNIELKRKMPTPRTIKEMYPLSGEPAKQKQENDDRIRSVFTGRSDRLILIIGPCSADREDAVLDYITGLRKLQSRVEEKILILPRVYTNKPRTTGAGYKGMLHQPDPHSSPDLFRGLIATRKLHMKVLSETGFSCADEMLYPETHEYLSDVLSYAAVGARSVENQLHRLTASSLDIPVGMKNPTGGDLTVMMNSITAAQSPHTFVYSGWEVCSSGNPLAHAILRGSANQYGRMIPNYHYEDLQLLCDLYDRAELMNPAVIIDANHCNSGKHYEEQPRIAKEVLHSARHNDRIRSLVKGLMIESYIEDGNQKADGGIYGKSITDGCIGWEKTERLILELADLL